jgi:hypothetical protein
MSSKVESRKVDDGFKRKVSTASRPTADRRGPIDALFGGSHRGSNESVAGKQLAQCGIESR